MINLHRKYLMELKQVTNVFIDIFIEIFSIIIEQLFISSQIQYETFIIIYLRQVYNMRLLLMQTIVLMINPLKWSLTWIVKWLALVIVKDYCGCFIYV